MVRVLHWLALRLSLLVSVLALVLLVPLALPVASVPMRLQQEIGRRAVALWQACALLGFRMGKRRTAATS